MMNEEECVEIIVLFLRVELNELKDLFLVMILIGEVDVLREEGEVYVCKFCDVEVFVI